nr:MAG TPA: hypothetical protein [Caudoviricetes sp.]
MSILVVLSRYEWIKGANSKDCEDHIIVSV